MYTLSDFLVSPAGSLRARLRSFCILIMLMAAIQAQSQVGITIQVMPPYTTKLSDYTSTPSKIIATLQNLSPTGGSLQVYLSGVISGESGIRIYSKPGYKPPQPITLQPGIPYLVTQQNIGDLFNVENLEFQGITVQQVVRGNGLPEDQYTICLRAFDYQTGLPLSGEEPEGCSAPFTLTSIEPPVVILPLCGDTVKALTPQAVLFSWTPSPGAPLTVRYKLRIVEVNPPGHDPNDAMQSAQPPYFFETNVNGTVFLFGAAQPALVAGKTYAFIVIAYDLFGKTSFRNEGKSEVCSFVYAGSGTDPFKITPTIGGGNTPPLNLAPTTTVSGKLLVKYPTNPDGTAQITIPVGVQPANVVIPAGVVPGKTGGSVQQGQGVSYHLVNQLGYQITGNSNQNNMGIKFNPPLGTNNGAPDALNDYGLDLIKVMNGKKFLFQDTESKQFTKPLPNTTVKLVARVAFMPFPGAFGVVHPDYGVAAPIMEGLDLTGAYRGDVMYYSNIVLAVTETDAQGNYSFTFNENFFTGPLVANDLKPDPVYDQPGVPTLEMLKNSVYPGCEFIQNLASLQGNFLQGEATQQQKVMMGSVKSDSHVGYLCLKVEVENQKFCSPDIDIFAMPGDVVEVPVQVAKLKTYNLTVEVKSDGTPNQLNTPDAPLAGVVVNILREQNKVNQEIPLILDYEGDKSDVKVSNSKGDFKLVSRDTTDSKGLLVFKNLVRHGYINPQYLIDLSTRNFDAASSAYDNTLYNYQDLFKALETTPDNVAKMVSYERVTYNFQYPQPTEVMFTYKMKPLPPEIKGRVMALSNLENAGLEGVRTELLNQQNYTKFSNYTSFIYGCYGNIEASQQTNASGFFRYENLPLKVNQNNGQVDGPYRRLYIRQPGYKPVIIPPFDQYPYKLLQGQLKDVKDINLEPSKMLSGYIEDEDGNAVMCYIKSTYSPYYKTEAIASSYSIITGQPVKKKEVFSVPVDDQATTLTIKPLSSQYFSRDTSLLIPGSELKVLVYKKLHRPSILVKTEQGDPIKGALVGIGEHIAVTDDQGIARFKFAAAGDQFVIRISAGQGYAGVLEALTIPVSPTWMPFQFVLKQAKSIKGYITEKATKVPVEGAKVYAELAQAGGMKLYIEATSDAQGFYQLHGIPLSQNQLTVHVTKEGTSPSYAGSVETVTFLQGPSKVIYHNFTVSKIDSWDLSTLLGFSVVIEHFQPVKTQPGQPVKAEVSGYLKNPTAIGGFALLQPDLKIPFGKITVIKGTGNKMLPESAVVTLEVMELPVEVANSYSGMLLNKSKPGGHGAGVYSVMPLLTKLMLESSGNDKLTGSIHGYLKLDLGSFNIAHDFKGTIYVGDDTLTGKVQVFSTAPQTLFSTKRNLFSINNNLQPVTVQGYRVFGFNAAAALEGSVIMGDVIRLATTLHTSIPGCTTCPGKVLDLKIRAGDLVLKGNTISFEETQGDKLSFEIEKWKVYGQKPWKFDINQDAIVLPEVLIVTGSGIDAKVLNMKIRPTSLSEGEIDLSSGGLTLGGIAQVKLSGNLKPVFNYDAGVGHYRISLVGETNQPAGWVDDLPNTSPKKLTFQSIGMLSNQQDILTIQQSFRFYDILDIYVDQIMTGPGFFKLNGQPDIGIPGYAPPSSVVAYTRESNKLVCRVEPLQGVVYATGNVEYILDVTNQQVTQGKFTTYGDVKIKPAPGEPGNPVMLRGFLTKTKNSCGFEIIRVDGAKKYKGTQMQVMMAGKNKILVESGQAIVVGGQWDTLKYKGLTTEIDGLNDNAAEPNLLEFKVFGGIDVDGSSIKMTNIETPLGGMKLLFDFEEGIMYGSLSINVPITMGYATLFKGTASIRLDKKGFYLVLNLKDFSIGPYTGFRGGFIAGVTDGVDIEDITDLQSTFRKSLPDFVNTGLLGFYVIGERRIIDKSINLVFADVSASAGLGLYVTTNFNSNPEFTVGGYAYVEVDGYASWEIPEVGPSCGAGVSLELLVDVAGGYKNDAFYMNNCGSLALQTYVTGSCGSVLDYLGLGELMDIITSNISAKLEFGITGTDIHMDFVPFATCE